MKIKKQRKIPLTVRLSPDNYKGAKKLKKRNESLSSYLNKCVEQIINK